MLTPHARVYNFGGYTLDLNRGCLREADREIKLRPKTFEVLTYFVSHAGRLLSKDELLEAAWAGITVTEDSLVQCVKEIRRAIGDSAQESIKTIPGRGYLFDLAVSTPAPTPQGEMAIEAPSETGADLLPGWLRRIRALDWRLAAAAIGVLVLLSAGIGWWLRAPVPLEASTTPPRLSIVVLPFVNLSSDPNQEYFADGFTEILTTDLSRIPGSFVIARNTAYTYKGKAVDAKQVGREIGVRYLLEGSVQRSANQVRINAQLIDAETGSHLWAESFDRERGDLFAIQDEITKRIARTLYLQVINLEARRAERWGTSADAMDYIMRAKALSVQPQSKENYRRMAELYKRALQLDEHLPSALIGLAGVLVDMVLDEISNTPEDDLRRADDLVSRALAVDPNDFRAHHIKGNILRVRKHYDEAIVEYETAITLNPMSVWSYANLGRIKMIIGEPAEAIPLLEEALKISPRDPASATAESRLGLANLLLGNTDEAIRWCKKAVLTDSNFFDAYRNLAAALALKGDNTAAQAVLAEVIKRDPDHATIAKVRSRYPSDRPKFVELFDSTVIAGLRKAGLPEE